jgi:hypothetical protein
VIITAASNPSQIHVQVRIRFTDATNHRLSAPTDPWYLPSRCVVATADIYGWYANKRLQCGLKNTRSIHGVSTTSNFSRCGKHSTSHRNANLILFRWGKFVSRHEEFIRQNQLKLLEFFIRDGRKQSSLALSLQFVPWVNICWHL